MAHVAFEDVTFTYPSSACPVLNHVSFDIPAGSWLLVAGASGCGKTTLLRQLVPELAPHGERTGRVLVGGEDLAALLPVERAGRVGFVMQDPAAQMVCDEVLAEIAFGLENLGWPAESIRLRVAEMASYFGIDGLLHRRCDELSGGQQQLVNLAAVMACDPELLVLDEPTAQLDPVATEGLLAAVARVRRDLGTTVVMSEHRFEETFPLVTRVLVLEGGRVACEGTPSRVASSLLAQGHPLARALPASALVAFGLGERGELPLTVRDGRSWLAARRVACAHDAAFACDDSHSAQAAPVPSPVTTVVRPSRAAVGDTRRAASHAAALDLRDVWFRYAKDAPDVLRGLDLAVERGSVHAVLGGNGCGKSTLLRVACGLARPVRGMVRVEGARLARLPVADTQGVPVALLPQSPRDLLTCDFVQLDLEQMPAAADKDLLDEIVGACGVAGLLDRDPYDLSGGEAQAAALAKVLLARPRVLMLDEPTKGVDAAGKERLAALLSGLAAQGTTVLLVSHDVDFCAAVATRVSLLFDGTVALTADPHDFFTQARLYTTAASRLSRGLAGPCATVEELVDACR